MNQRAKLMDLMARKEKINLHSAARELKTAVQQQAQNQQYQSQLSMLLGAARASNATTKSQLVSDHWFGFEMADQLDQVKAQSEIIASKRASAAAKVARIEARSSNFTQKAKDAKSQARRIAEERALDKIIEADLSS